MSTHILVVSSAKSHSDVRRPRIRITGFWLNEFGFEPGKLVTVSYQEDRLVLTAHEKGFESYSRLVKKTLKNKDGLLEVREEFSNNKKTPTITLMGLWLRDLGFKRGDVVVVKASQDLMILKVFDASSL